MIKKYQKIFCVVAYLLIFLCAVSFCLPASRASAVTLEVNYPTISGVNPNTDENLTLPKYIVYLFNAGMFVGFFIVFLSLIIAGVMYLLSPISSNLVASAKDRISGAISGLLILVLTYLIVITINPQLSVFATHPSQVVPQPEIKKIPGVYFYKKDGDCPDKPAQLSTTSNIDNLGDLAKKVHSIGIIQDPDTQTAYITILYDKTNFWGKCQYITTDNESPNQTCKKVDAFAASASVYKYDFNPQDNNVSNAGVYFYRKSCFNSQQTNNVKDIITKCNKDSGGYFKAEIGKDIYVKSLEELCFAEGGVCNNNDACTVPENERDCTKYNKDGTCSKLKCPNLGGENISSIVINGNYLVMLVYFQVGTDTETSWTFCQEFPTSSDINKIGPQQIKWENIRNNNNTSSDNKVTGVVPNYVIIIPIQK